ncbi:ATP-dependent translocase ABCB1 [Lamellibrachia satsuma]|nr:ATP-dependent translocase ABCB1 [Lamellibrachia satsuma]
MLPVVSMLLRCSVSSCSHPFVTTAITEEFAVPEFPTKAADGRRNVEYAANLTEAKVFGIRKSRASGLGIGCVYVIMFSAYGLVFWFGAKMVQDGDLTVGRLITVFFCILVAAFMLGKAAPCLETFATGRAAARALWQIIDRIPPIDSGSYSGVRPSRMEGNVVFKDVNFSYPSRATVQVLNGLSLNVAVGQTVALVGASGCGKSTVIQLIQRFYDPLGGAVYIDNQPINELNVRYLRRRIGVVSQEPVLFATTIAENIRYGLEEANQEDIESAARQANAHNFIMELPKKYDTLVGERGAQLSGGQKQRIAIARALVRDPRILLLDEATSALDTESEATVQAALDKARMGRTTIVVAHRLSTIKTADLIIGMKDGMAVEQGSHDELMDQKGIYCELVTRQISQLVELESANTSGTRPTGRTLTSDRTTESLHAKRVDSQNDSRVACVEDTEELAKPSMKRILRLNSREWPCIFLGCCMALLVGAQQPAFAIIFSEFLGVFVETDRNKQQKEIRFYCVMFVVIGFVSGVAKFLQMYMFGISGECLTLRLRRLTFQTLLRQEIGFFDDPRHGTGALMTRLSTDASDVHGASGSRLAVALEGGSSVIAGVFIGLYYSWELTLLIFGFTPLLVIAIKITMKMTGGHAAQGSDALEEAGKLAVEAMENIRTVASLSKEASFVRQYKHLTEKPFRRRLQTVNMIGLSFGFSQALIYLMQSVAFYGGGWLIEHRGLTFENMFK